jgi:hypothetical protein
MTTTYHTAITTGAAANAATINTPLSSLDSALVAQDTRIDHIHDSTGHLTATALTGQTQWGQIHNTTGTLKTNVAILTKQAQIELDSAGLDNGDAVRYDEYSVHNHATEGGYIYDTIYAVHSASTAVGINAAALSTFSVSSASTATKTLIRTSFYNDGATWLGLAGKGTNAKMPVAPSAYLEVRIGSTAYISKTLPAGMGPTSFFSTGSISSLSTGTAYEVDVVMFWKTSGGSDNATLSLPQLISIKKGMYA